MSAKVSDWIKKAERDFETACRELRVTSDPNYDAVCFHCQQCIEKLLKGALLKSGVEPPFVHDIAYLIKLLRDSGTELIAEEADVRLLSQSAVVFRYPGENASRADATEVMSICERLRGDLLVLLGERLL